VVTNKKTIMTITPIKKGQWHLDFKGKTKPMSAHRFVQLMGWETYVTKSELLLDFFDLKITTPNIRMELGSTMEQTILDYEYSDDVYIHYEMNSENKGNIIDPDCMEDVNGIPDAVVITRGSLGEVKCTTSTDNSCKTSWYKQAQFYAYYWNKYLSEKTGLSIDHIEILRYYVPDNMIAYQIANYDTLVIDNYCKFVFELDEDIENDIKTAKEKQKKLIDGGMKITSRNNKLLWQIAMGVLNKKIKLKYDDKDKDCIEFVDIINSIIKEEKRKVNETN
jgi:hypothetical protein